MKEFILAMFGFDYESRKELFTLSTLKIASFLIVMTAIVGLVEGI